MRLEQGISQERLAADAGIDRAYVSEIERGLANVGIDLLDRVAGVLDVRIGDLFDESTGDVETPDLPRGRRRKSS